MNNFIHRDSNPNNGLSLSISSPNNDSNSIMPTSVSPSIQTNLYGTGNNSNNSIPILNTPSPSSLNLTPPFKKSIPIIKEILHEVIHPKYDHYLSRIISQTQIYNAKVVVSSETGNYNVQIESFNEESLEKAYNLINSSINLRIKLKSVHVIGNENGSTKSDTSTFPGNISPLTSIPSSRDPSNTQKNNIIMLEFNVSPDLVGLAIGKKGIRIKQIEQTTNVTSIVVGSYGHIIVYGTTEESVNYAKKLLLLQEDYFNVTKLQFDWISSSSTIHILHNFKVKSDLLLVKINKDLNRVHVIGTEDAISKAHTEFHNYVLKQFVIYSQSKSNRQGYLNANLASTHYSPTHNNFELSNINANIYTSAASITSSSTSNNNSNNSNYYGDNNSHANSNNTQSQNYSPNNSLYYTESPHPNYHHSQPFYPQLNQSNNQYQHYYDSKQHNIPQSSNQQFPHYFQDSGNNQINYSNSSNPLPYSHYPPYQYSNQYHNYGNNFNYSGSLPSNLSPNPRSMHPTTFNSVNNERIHISPSLSSSSSSSNSPTNNYLENSTGPFNFSTSFAVGSSSDSNNTSNGSYYENTFSKIERPSYASINLSSISSHIIPPNQNSSLINQSMVNNEFFMPNNSLGALSTESNISSYLSIHSNSSNSSLFPLSQASSSSEHSILNNTSPSFNINGISSSPSFN